MSGDEISPLAAGLAILLLGIAVAADYVLGWAWWPPYFRTGVLLYRARLPIQIPKSHPGARFLATAIDLEGEFDGDLIGRQLTFQQLGQNEIAIRRGFLRGRWLSGPVALLGLIHHDPDSDTVVVEARANCLLLGLLVVATATCVAFESIVPLAIAALFLAFCIPQCGTFRRIGEFVAGRPS